MLIGLSGNAGTGKDTAADYLVKKLGYTKISLADEMKRICKRVYDFSDDQLWGPSESRNRPDKRYLRRRYTADGKEWLGEFGVEVFSEYLSPRIALQILGTEFGRNCYINTWVDYTLRVVEDVLNGFCSYTQIGGLFWDGSPCPAGVVIPDVRFKNEIDAIKAAGGKVIRLKRKTEADALTVGVKNHASAAEQQGISDEEFDYVLEVPEGFDNYHVAIDAMMATLNGN